MDNHLNFAEHLARLAGEILLEYFNLSGTPTQVKEDHSVVTEADLSADRAIAAALAGQYPDDRLVSEELQPVSPEKAEVVWVIDPLDGTTNFSLGLPFWGVSVARLVDGYPERAALYFPPIQETYTAQRGKGAWMNGKPIHVRPTEKGQPAAFFACCSRAHRHYQIDIRYKPRILGSAAYNLCAVARGLAVLGFEAHPKIWDLAAGWLLVEEAGGIIEPLEGGEAPFPLLAQADYRLLNFPTIIAADRRQADIAHANIRSRSRS
jgi:myo-inositol-1(or 4)-monophosphatase